jgi:hypothetical protein
MVKRLKRKTSFYTFIFEINLTSIVGAQKKFKIFVTYRFLLNRYTMYSLADKLFILCNLIYCI